MCASCVRPLPPRRGFPAPPPRPKSCPQGRGFGGPPGDDGLFSELTQQLAQTTGKPAQYITMQVVLTSSWPSGPPLVRALCTLHSIHKIGGMQNHTYSKLLCGLLADRLCVRPDRIYINY
ncbi:Macrophage migration inhibitory factor [Tupaia chinensis]|uniref:Macrophage migration inhibitory factor n=1 Tax=Tupaia chinensis TaxID=246437 RepID=L9KF60_TUPCH|nr:Macrophage migration inhibitory factor [Tupaia chinensis]